MRDPYKKKLELLEAHEMTSRVHKTTANKKVAWIFETVTPVRNPFDYTPYDETTYVVRVFNNNQLMEEREYFDLEDAKNWASLWIYPEDMVLPN